MRFQCPRCQFDEKEDSGLTPLCVRCPGCGASWSPEAGRWVPHQGHTTAPARRGKRVELAPAFGLAWMSRPARA